MKTNKSVESKPSQLTLDEINRVLDLARERDPSIEPDPGYSDGFLPTAPFGWRPRNQPVHPYRGWLYQGHAPTDAVDIAVGLYNQIQECAGRCASGGEGELLCERSKAAWAISMRDYENLGRVSRSSAEESTTSAFLGCLKNFNAFGTPRIGHVVEGRWTHETRPNLSRSLQVAKHQPQPHR
jgi:hypothetical protein